VNSCVLKLNFHGGEIQELELSLPASNALIITFQSNLEKSVWFSYIRLLCDKTGDSWGPTGWA